MSAGTRVRRGHLVGRYRVVRPLGIGSTSTAYLARAPGGRPVVVKVFHARATGADDPGWRRERALVADAPDGTVLSLSDAGVADLGGATHAFLVFPYVPGTTLGRRIARGPLPVPAVRRLLGDLVDALERLHAAGIVHLDVKPDNVWLGDDGRARLLDLGAGGRVGEPVGAVVGRGTTLPYAAPEQLDPDAVLDGRADLFAAGSTVVEALLPRARAGGAPWPWRALERLRAATRGPASLRAHLARLVEPEVERREPSATACRERLEGDGATGTTADPTAGPRARILLRMHAAFPRAHDATGRVLTLCGGAGFGKTHLVGALARAVRAEGGDVVAVRGPTGAPTTGWAELVEALGVPGPDGPPARLVAAAAEALDRRAAAEPVLLIVEDLHAVARGWEPWLRELTAPVPGRRVLAVLTARDPDVLARVAPGAASFVLGPLTPGELRALLAERLGGPGPAERWAATVHRASGGVPLAALEALELLGVRPGTARRAPVPRRGPVRRPVGDPLPALVLHRLEALPSAIRGVLDVAACGGPQGAVEDLLATAPGGRAAARRALRTLVAGGWLVVRGGRWAFAHDVLHETVLGRVAAPVRAEAHAVVARRLLASAPDLGRLGPAAAARLAHHVAHACDGALLATAGRPLVRALLAAQAPEAAVELLQALRDDAALTDDDDDLRLRWQGVAALSWLVRPRDAEALAREAVLAAGRRRDPRLEARALGVLHEVVSEARRTEASALLRRADRRAAAAGDAGLQFRCRAARLWLERGRRPRAASIATGLALLDEARRRRDVGQVRVVGCTVALLRLEAGQARAAGRAARAIHRAAVAAGDAAVAGRAELTAVLADAARGRLGASLAALQAFDARARAEGEHGLLGRTALARADLLVAAGRFAAARTEATRARGLLREAGAVVLDGVQAEVVLAAAALGEGRLEAARAHAAAARRAIEATGGTEDLPRALRVAAEAALEAGRRAEAAEALRALARVARRTGLAPLRPALDLLGARAALADGRPGLAATRARRAAAAAARLEGSGSVAAEALVLSGRIATARGDRREAERRFRRARDVARRTGASAWAAAAEVELARTTGRAPPRRRAELARLPAAERIALGVGDDGGPGPWDGDGLDVVAVLRQRALDPGADGTKKRPRTRT